MVRKVYLDFLKRQLRAGRLGWVARLGVQYGLTKLSFLAGRPLCGPILGTLFTNYECNLRCRMCRLPEAGRLPAGGRLPVLTTGEMKGVIDGFARLGTRGIGFTGGEPLLRKDLFELLAHARSRGMLTHLNSNGTLVDGEAAARMVDAGTDSLNISLDGATESTHDRTRGVPGSFRRTVEAVRVVDRERKRRGAPLRLKVVGVLSAENLDEVPAWLRLAAGLGVDCVELIPEQPFADGPGKGAAADPRLLAKVEATVRYLRDPANLPVPLENSPRMLSLFLPTFRGEPSPLRCHAGYNSLAVDCHGRLFPCVPYANWNRPAATLDGRPLEVAWRSARYGEARRETARCRACTLNCQAELNLLFNPFLRLAEGGVRP